MATPEENMAAAQARADKARAEGNLERAARWEASVDRYRRLIEIKQNLAESKARIEEIKENLAQSSQGSSGNNNGSRGNKTPTSSIITVADDSCPSGFKRVRINYLDGLEVGRVDLGCSGYERQDPDRAVSTGNNTTQPVVAPTPPSPPPPPPPPPPVKTAPIDTILFDDNTVPIEIMTDLIFEDIGGQEIINIVRNDTVIGQNIIYQPIKNLSLINQQYNPNNVLALQGTSDKYFENFIIKLFNKQPTEGNGINGSNLYIDENTADIVLDLINIQQDEQAEFQFRIDGTIYEAEL